MGKLYCKVDKKWCKLLKRGVCTYCNLNINEVPRCPRLAEIETIRLSDILKKVTFKSVFESLTKWFDGQEPSINGYHEVFRKICTMKPHKHNLNDLFINITRVFEDGREWLDVDGMSLNNNIRYGIEFCPWNDWVSMFITQKTLDNLTPEDIVAGCLYEMTFYGFTEDKVDESKNELIKSVEECKKSIEEEKKCA